MKKAVRITAWILGLLLLLQVGAVVVLQSPAVQTWLGKQVIGQLQEKMDADISFESASIRPFDALVLENVLVMDRAAPLPGMDTLLHVRHLSARFSLMGLLSGGNIRIKRANLDGGCFHLVIEDSPDGSTETTNLERIFRMPPSKGDAHYHWGDILDARNLEIRDFHFRMENIPGARDMGEKALAYGEEAIDWNHLNLIVEHLKSGRIRMADDLITADVRELTVRELVTGLRLDGLSARKVQVGKANVLIDELRGRLSPGSTALNLPTFRMEGPMDAYGDFVDAIRLYAELAEGTQVDMHTISHFAPGLEKMGFRGGIRGRLDGTVADFRLLDVAVDGQNENIHLRTTGRMTGLPDVEATRLDFQIHQLGFSMADLTGFVRDWAPEVELDALKGLAPGERFTLTGRVGGMLNAMDIDAGITSPIGDIRTGLSIHNAVSQQHAIAIGGSLETDRLNLGSLLSSKDLGPLTMRASLDAVLPDKDGLQVQLDSLHISQLTALGYAYGNIGLRGRYHAPDFDVNLRAADPNLQLAVNSVYHEKTDRDGHMSLDVKLDRADLQKLNLDRRGGKSVVSLNARARLTRENAHTLGTLKVGGIRLVNDSGAHPVEDLTLHLDETEGDYRLKMASALLNASYRGEKDISAFIRDLRSLVVDRQLPALTAEPAVYSGAAYSVDIQALDLQNLLDFVAPGMYVENGTRAGLSVSGDGLLKAGVTSGRIALNEKYIKDLELDLGNGEGTITAEITGKTVALGSTHLHNNRLTLYAADNRVGLGYTFDNETDADTRAELYLNGDLDRDEKGLSVTAAALPSNLYYQGNGWGISSGDITYHAGHLHIDKLLARHEEQQLLIDGGYSPGKADTLSLTMDRFELGLVNTIAGEGLPAMEGQLTGRARLLSSAGSTTPVLLAGLVCDSTRLGGKRIGQLRLSSVWDEPGNRFRVHLRNKLDGREALSAHASILPSTGEVQGDVNMDRFSLGLAEPFLTSVFYRFDGALSGKMSLSGPWNNLQIGSQDLRLDDGLLCPDFTRVPYYAAGAVSMDRKGLHFLDVGLTDGENGTGKVTGSLLFNLRDLRNIRTDIHIRMTDMRALALPRGTNPLLWGDLYATGKVDITGPLNRITLSLDAANTGEGSIHLPIGSSSSGSSTDILSFTQPGNPLLEDPYERMMALQQETYRQSSDLRFTGRIQATPSLQVNLDLGDDNTLTAYGNGTIELASSAAQGFTLGGDYAISDGSFHFSAMNLVNRKFTILEGSSVRFNGEVMDTDLNVKGRYTTKASISNLIPSYDEGASSARHTVFCGINISGKLRNPVVDFDIDVPDLNPIVQTQVESALNSEDKVQKQFVYLLIAGNFLPTEESGVTTNGSDVLYSNVSSIMSGQLNNIFQKLDIPLDLGLNYQTTQAGLNLFDVAVSTQLFNNRVIVNGTVGNKQLMGGLTTNEIAGDLDVEIKLNRSGSLRLSLFSHSADQYTYYLDNSQRNGGGIAYQREFNSIVQFFRELFSSSARREQMALEAATRPAENIVLQIDENGKSHEQ